MSNPARPPKVFTSEQIALAVAPDVWLPEGFQDLAEKYATIEEAQRVLAKLDMSLAKTIELPRELSAVPAIRLSNKQVLARADKGKPMPRVKSAVAKGLANVVFAALPEATKMAAKEKMESMAFVKGGAECTLGRLELAYPRVGARAPKPVLPGEAYLALSECGLSLDNCTDDECRPRSLVPKRGEIGVTVNPHSENGFPVGGFWTDDGAANRCMALALRVEEEIRKEPARTWVLRQQEERPYMVAVKGKAKADHYSGEKVSTCRMRFYNVLPRHIVLNMQKATQVWEELADNIVSNDATHTAIGVTLTRGGGDDLVSALEAQLLRDDEAFVHVGDDSWVIKRVGGKLVMFALDCSNFDLTQHADCTLAIHRVMRDELARIDEPSADLWYAYARSRLVVVTGTLARYFKHGGPSGMPLQSKVNDMLMHVMIKRALKRIDEPGEAVVREAVRHAAADMGFVAKLEQYVALEARTIREALTSQPFLFIGYYFYTEGGIVQVHCDVPRMMAQLPFPTQKWLATKDELAVMEAMRLGSICMNLGLPTAELKPAFDAFQQRAAQVLRETIARFGDVEDDSLRWAVSENPFAGVTEASLGGLLRALERGPEWLWSMGDKLPRQLPLMVEVPRAMRASLPAARPTEFPATMANDGRPPPSTAKYGPPKPKRDVGGPSGVSRKGRRRRGLEEVLEAESDEEDDASYESDSDAWDDHELL